LNEDTTMGNVQELYESRIRPLVPAERLQLARLILDDLTPPGSAIDVSDEWGDDDVADVAAYSARHGDESTPGAGGGNEPG
jgi:hypothetical protein